MMNKYKERLEELDMILSTECGKYENDCNKCPYCKECQEYSKLKGWQTSTEQRKEQRYV